jgi:hypothetical protein
MEGRLLNTDMTKLDLHGHSSQKTFSGLYTVVLELYE